MSAPDATPPDRPDRSDGGVITTGAAANSETGTAGPDQALSGQPRLRLIAASPASPLSILVECVEAEYAERHHAMLERLALVEEALSPYRASDIHGALEQIAFVRVGFRCIADAIGELVEHAVRLDADSGQRPFSTDGRSA